MCWYLLGSLPEATGIPRAHPHKHTHEALLQQASVKQCRYLPFPLFYMKSYSNQYMTAIFYNAVLKKTVCIELDLLSVNLKLKQVPQLQEQTQVNRWCQVNRLYKGLFAMHTAAVISTQGIL